MIERHLTPQDIHDRYKVLNGAIYGLASHGRFMGAFKPGNRSRQVRGLYLAGGAAHPGPGMPMVMMSGWIAADALDTDLKPREPPRPLEASVGQGRSQNWGRRRPGRRGVSRGASLGPASPIHGLVFPPVLFAAHERVAHGRLGPTGAAAGTGPLVIYSNHPAWWDAAVYILAAHRLFPDRESYAPIDADMLQQYGIFGRIGAFGVDLEFRARRRRLPERQRRDPVRRNRAFWITAQGRFSDVRERPLGVKPGIARLPELAPNCTVLPLAIEYSFWLDRGAEAFIAFGPPIQARDLLALRRGARLQRLQETLTSLVDQLSADVQTRDPTRFQIVLAGHSGIGGVYDRWRRLVATVRGRAFDPSHERRAA